MSTASVATFELSSQLPRCYDFERGQVYYVKADGKFYYCNGKKYREIHVDAEPDTRWLTQLSVAEDCPNGGTLIQVGPDLNGDSILTGPELVASDSVCNGVDGEDGEDGRDGAPGVDGSSCSVAPGDEPGTHVISCTDGTSAVIRDGADGEDGTDGSNGTSCTLESDEEAGTHTITCGEDSATVSDGSDGADCTVEDGETTGTHVITCGETTAVVTDGEDGADGIDGEDGDSCTVSTDEVTGVHTISCGDTTADVSDGADGADGGSCTVADNQDSTFTITCEDGSEVTFSDGEDGADAAPVLIETVAINFFTQPCLLGGRRINVGTDLNADGDLQAGEITSTAAICRRF